MVRWGRGVLLKTITIASSTSARCGGHATEIPTCPGSAGPLSQHMATRKKKPVDISQQEELQQAMEELGMTRKEFAARISVSVRTLHKWLLPSESSDFRKLPAMGRAYVREILEWHRQQHGATDDAEQ